MPFPFALPSTSLVSYPTYFSSTTHPLLPLTATNHRTVLRNALKKYRRLAPASQSSDLSAVHSAITDYLPYLFALDAGLSGKLVAGEEIDIVLEREVELEWRATLTATLPGRAPRRLQGHGLDYEISFVLATLAYTHTLLARSHLHTLYGPTTPTPDQRAAAITTATKHLLHAHALHTYLLHALDRHPAVSGPGPGPVDISAPVQSGLASLALADATLLAVLKDDPYPAAVAQERNRLDREWMIKAPELPKVRAHLFARLCLAAAEHAGRAGAMLGGGSSSAGTGGDGKMMVDVLAGAKKDKVDEGLVKYADGLRRVGRGKACRFLGIDAELGGRTGEGIAWLRAGRRELGLVGGSGEKGEEAGRSLVGLARLRKEWTEKREDRRVERGREWGVDAGRLEEGRVMDLLERKWVKMNDTVSLFCSPRRELARDGYWY